MRNDLIRDLRHSLRQIARAPGFFAIAALLIATGIAATTQIFTFVDALLLRPLPVRDPQNLVQLFEQQPKRPADPFFDFGFYRRLAHNSATLFAVVGQIDTARSWESNGRVERVHAVAVTADFFTHFGVAPLLGRLLGENDTHVAVLAYPFWSRSFGSDPKVLGQVMRLQGHPFTIVGIASQGFTGTTIDSSPDLWMPFTNLPDFSRVPDPNMDHYVTEIIARLRPGVSVDRAQQDAAAAWLRYLQETAPTDAGDYHRLKRGRLEVHSIAHGISPIRDQSKTAILLLLAGTGLLMLMVCANVGGLLLSRATARERETAIRVALGASRKRILQQRFTESLLLTCVGGCAGLSLAYAGLPVLTRMMPPAHGIGFDPGEIRTLAIRPSLDLRVAGFCLALCLLTAVICALAPAWSSVRADVNTALKSALSDRKNRFFQSVLCGFQVALCTTLLISAGSIVRSLANLRAVDSGFDRDHVTVFSIDPHIRGYDSQRNWSLQRRLLNGVRNLPGAEGAALADRALMRGIGLGVSVVFPGDTGGVINCSFNSVSPEYFNVLKIRLLAGRTFTQFDSAESKLTHVIVNEAFVRKFLPGRQALAATFATGQKFVEPKYEIVGVVSDTRYRSLRETPPPILYTDAFGPTAYPDTFILHVRSQGDPHAIIQPVRHLLQSIDPALPLYQVATLSEEVNHSLWQERLLSTLTSCFAAFALALSAIGLYGILAYYVTRRNREVGLRMALGASSQQVVWLVIQRIVPILAIGVIAGAALSRLITVSAQSLLFGVQLVDPLANIAAALLLVAIGVGAAVAPTLRALRIDPAATLRQE